MESCVFCGPTQDDMTTEHVIPKWARRAFDVQGGVTIHTRDSPSAQMEQIGRISDLNIVLKGCICAPCNNVWLADIERKVQPFLQPMVVSAKPTTLDLTAQRLLGLWAVKTCLLLELAFRQRYAPGRRTGGYLASPQELTWLRVRNEPPPRSMVWLGCWDCEQKAPMRYEPSGAELPTADGVPVIGHLTTYTLGYVAFQVFTVDFIAAEQHCAPGWNAGPPERLEKALHRIWPLQPIAGPVKWPPHAFRYDDWHRLVTWSGVLRPRP